MPSAANCMRIHTCVYHPLTCPFSNCDYVDTKDDLITHLKDHHKVDKGYNTWSYPVRKENGEARAIVISYRPFMIEGPFGETILTRVYIDHAMCLDGILIVKCMSISTHPTSGVSAAVPRVSLTLTGDNGESESTWSTNCSAPRLRDEHGHNKGFVNVLPMLYVPVTVLALHGRRISLTVEVL